MISSINGSGSYMSMMYSQSVQQPKKDSSQFFNEIDTDGNGSIGETELTSMAENFAAMTGETISVDGAITTYDTDGDGELSQEEMKIFMDENVPPPPDMAEGMSGQDDFSMSALMNMMGNIQNTEEEESDDFFSRIDTDGDGGISQSELTTLVEDFTEKTGETIAIDDDTIATYDTDGDGQLSAEELKAFMDENAPPPPEMTSAMPDMTDFATSTLMNMVGKSDDDSDDSTDSVEGISSFDQEILKTMAGEFAETTSQFMGVEELMSAFDSDEDGSLNQDELESLLSQTSPQPQFPMQQALSAYRPYVDTASFGMTA